MHRFQMPAPIGDAGKNGELPVGETSWSQLSRSAVACPLRALDCADDGEGQALALRYRTPFFYRRAWALGCHTRIRAGFPRDGSRTVFIVARGPVPREFHRQAVVF